MGIKEFIKETISDYKKNKDKKNELKKIKQDAYFEEMKKQSKMMGEKQAQIEARSREIKFQYKQNMEFEKIKNRTNSEKREQVDYFGLNRWVPKEVKII